MSPKPEGVQIGKYRVLRLLASGGMGEVFLARVDGPGGFEKTLVLKRVLKKLQREPRFIEMFLNEARVAAQLSHPNVVQIFELAELDGGYVIAMEYVEGLSLRALMIALKKKHLELPPPLAAWLCAQALQGLHYAHLLRDEGGRVRGVVHRDVSPENILLGFNGSVKVADFGLARAAEAAVDRVVLGKVSYMAPEQRLGGLIDARADVYAMGVVLSELITGRPLDGLAGRPALNDSTFEPIVARALSPHPDGRYLSAGAMAAALEEYARTSADATATRLGEVVRLAALQLENHESPGPPLRTQLTMPGYTPEVVSSAPEANPNDVRAVPSRPELPRVTAPLDFPAVGAKQSGSAGARPRWVALSAGLAFGAAAALWWLLPRRAPAEQDNGLPDASSTPPTRLTETAAPTPLAMDAGLVPLPATPLARDGGGRPTAPAQPGHVPRPLTGLVQVRVHPWADVYWGSRRLGTTPFPPVTLPAGRQVLTLKNPELNVTREVVVLVKAGAEVTVFESFLK